MNEWFMRLTSAATDASSVSPSTDYTVHASAQAADVARFERALGGAAPPVAAGNDRREKVAGVMAGALQTPLSPIGPASDVASMRQALVALGDKVQARHAALQDELANLSSLGAPGLFQLQADVIAARIQDEVIGTVVKKSTQSIVDLTQMH